MSYENKFVLSLFIGGYKEIKNKKTPQQHSCALYFIISTVLISYYHHHNNNGSDWSSCLADTGIRRLFPYNTNNKVFQVWKCRVRSGARRTNSMNINQLWRRAANPEADIWLLHTEQSWRHHPNVSEKSNISLTAFPPALLRTSALNSSNANRNKHRNNWQLLTWTSLCSLKLNQAYCYKPYVYHFPVCVPMFTVLLSNNSSSSYVN